MIPVFIVLRNLGLIDTLAGLVLVFPESVWKSVRAAKQATPRGGREQPEQWETEKDSGRCAVAAGGQVPAVEDRDRDSGVPEFLAGRIDSATLAQRLTDGWNKANA